MYRSNKSYLFYALLFLLTSSLYSMSTDDNLQSSNEHFIDSLKPPIGPSLIFAFGIEVPHLDPHSSDQSVYAPTLLAHEPNPVVDKTVHSLNEQNQSVYEPDQPTDKPFSEKIEKIVISRDGKKLCSIGSYGTVWIADIAEKHGEVASEVVLTEKGTNVDLVEFVLSEKSDTIDFVEFFAHNTKVFIGSKSGNLTLWDCQKGEKIARLEGHTDSIIRVALNDTTTHSATLSKDKTVWFWDIVTGQGEKYDSRDDGERVDKVEFFKGSNSFYLSYKIDEQHQVPRRIIYTPSSKKAKTPRFSYKEKIPEVSYLRPSY